MSNTTAETVQQQVGEAKIDYNALDNTTAGRALQAGFIGAFAAVPNTLARVGIAVAGIATVAAFNAFDEDPRNDLTARIDDTNQPASPARTWGLAALVAGGLTLGLKGFAAGHDAAAGALSKRGVPSPNTLLGVAAGTAAFAASELASRR